MSTLEDNFERLRAAVDAMLQAGRAPLTFVDLDDTLNRSFGGLIEPAAVTALQGVAQAGGLFGVNTGADIVWAGERILCETERHFSFPFMLLATGTQIYVWVDLLRAYARLPMRAEDKGAAMRMLADYIDVPLDCFIYIADFPGGGDRQEGIDDPVLRQAVGVVVNVGGRRTPEVLPYASKQTLVLNPERRGNDLVGTDYEATARYLACIAEALRDERHAMQAQAYHAELERRVERKLGVNVEASASQGCLLWTFEQRELERIDGGPVRIVVRGEGLVHAGVSRDGAWVRTYDIPLREVGPGLWEATLLDPEINEFTFIWYDPQRSGKVHWEGRNFALRGAAVARSSR
jgi:hypothetical protein